MPNLSTFPVTHKWPAQHPERLQLYSLPTPNGVKVSIMQEETGLPYEPHLVSFETNDQLSPEFLSLNPNNKIPAILDPNGPEWLCHAGTGGVCGAWTGDSTAGLIDRNLLSI